MSNTKPSLVLAFLCFLIIAIAFFIASLILKKEKLVTTIMKNATSYLWNFSQGSTLQSWVMTHSLSEAKITKDGLTTKVNGFDPYMHSPIISVAAEKQKKVIVAAKVLGNATALKLYWISSESPNWGEDKSFIIPTISDGSLHEYVFDLSQSNAWKNTITQIRLDLEPENCYDAELSILYIKIPVSGPELSLEGPYLSTPIPTVGKEFNISVHLINIGGEKLNLTLEIEIPKSLRIVKGKKVTISELDINKGKNFSWTFIGNESAFYDFRINITSNSEKLCTTIFSFSVYPEVNLEDLVNKVRSADDNKITQVEDGSFILKSGSRAIYFVGSKIGYGPIIVFLNNKEDLKPLGVFGAFASLTTTKRKGEKEQSFIIPKNFTLEEKSIEFAQINEKWNFTSKWKVINNSIVVENKLKALKNLSISRFSVSFYPGELSFGSTKSEALFPGLEWLVGNEVSSNTLDIKSPLNLRPVPNPIKVTIPLMAVRYDNSLVALMWDPYASWDGVHKNLQPEFASSNWIENQNNHLLSLFVPIVPNWVEENHYEAYFPYKLEQEKQLNISFILYAASSNTVLDAVKEWIRFFGLPNPRFPRDFDEELKLSMQAYLSSLWTPGRGWSHASGWNPEPFPGYSLLLLLTSLHFQEKDPKFSDELMLRFNESLSLALNNGPAYLASEDGLHIPGWQLPFYVGYLEEGLSSTKSYVYSLISTQDKEGEWSFKPSANTYDLGTAGTKELGTTATPAAEVLRFARITGDKLALVSGLKALEAMEKYYVPRAAQTWEIPVHTPDILASARAIDAYLEGYIATEKKECLERAKYWAYSGLPFVYLWSKEDRPVMLYATIPVYGATHYISPVWIGRPVQWCGLVYAYELLRLSKYDDSFPWELIAEGILSSGIRQQLTYSFTGTFPDSWDLTSNIAYGPYINPEDLVKPTLALIGLDPDLNTVVLRTQRSNITITTPSKILEAEANNTQAKLKLSFFKNESNYILISGFKVDSILKVNEGRLRYAENLNNTAEGWKTLGYITIIKLRFSSQELELTLFGNVTS